MTLGPPPVSSVSGTAMDGQPFLPTRFRAWAHLAETLGFVDFVAAQDQFKALLGTAGPWVRRDDCGIYFWTADDGETYVGQTVSARKRLLAHLRNYPDLAYAAFLPVPREALDAAEQAILQAVCEAGYLTRNIKFAIDTNRRVPLDHFISHSERTDFLQGKSLENWNWQELPLLEQKKRKPFTKLTEEPDFSQILRVVRLYLERVVPFAALTEVKFWSASLYVQSHILRINVGQQEVFTVGRNEDGALYVRPLSVTRIGPHADGPFYQSGSYDAWMPAATLADWLQHTNLASCRALVIRLMRHTTTLNSGNHCPQIIRASFAEQF